MTSAAGSIGVAEVDCRSSINGTYVIAVAVAVAVCNIFRPIRDVD